MFTKSIGRLAANANRRRDARAVRIHPEVGQVPSPAKHRAPARDAAGAMRQIRAEAPPAPAPLPDAFHFEPFALEWMDQDIGRMRADAADKESHANQLLGEAARLRTAADNWERLRRIADVFTTDEPQPPIAEATETDESLPFEVVTQVEDEHMARVARFASRAEAEAYVMRPPSSLARIDLYVVGPDDPDAQPWKEAAAAAAAVDTLESMSPAGVPAPVSGPAAVPQMDPAVAENAKRAFSFIVGDGDPDTAMLSPVRDGDTVTDVMAQSGADR